MFTQDTKQLAEIDEILLQAREEAEEIEEAEMAIGEEDSTVVRLVNKIVLDAHARGASDIHIEPYPGKENTEVRPQLRKKFNWVSVVPPQADPLSVACVFVIALYLFRQ